jgi:hypothetical protein
LIILDHNFDGPMIQKAACRVDFAGCECSALFVVEATRVIPRE